MEIIILNKLSKAILIGLGLSIPFSLIASPEDDITIRVMDMNEYSIDNVMQNIELPEMDLIAVDDSNRGRNQGNANNSSEQSNENEHRHSSDREQESEQDMGTDREQEMENEHGNDIGPEMDIEMENEIENEMESEQIQESNGRGEIELEDTETSPIEHDEIDNQRPQDTEAMDIPESTEFTEIPIAADTMDSPQVDVSAENIADSTEAVDSLEVVNSLEVVDSPEVVNSTDTIQAVEIYQDQGILP